MSFGGIDRLFEEKNYGDCAFLMKFGRMIYNRDEI